MANETGYTKGSLKTIACRFGLKRNTKYDKIDGESWVRLVDMNLSKYEISNFGRMRRYDNGAIVKQSRHHQSGYLQVRIDDDSNNKVSKLVHVLVAKSFVYNDNSEKTQIDHIDRNRTNNSVENLRYVTPSENANNQKSLDKPTVYLTESEVVDICVKLEYGMSISQIVGTNSKYTKSRVEKIKQRIRWTNISINYNF